jgi:hypothetical protein
MRSTLLLAAVAVLGASVAVAGNPSSILARAKAAAGGAALDGVRSIHAKEQVTTGGLTGSAELLTDVLTGRYVERYALGPARGAEGFDGHVAWSQDTSGQARVEEGGDARLGAIDEAYRQALGYWYPQRWPAKIEDAGERSEGGRRFLTLRITPKGGRPFELWLDAATMLIDRTVEKTAIETRTTFFSDYRTVDGVKLPFASHSTNGEPRYDERSVVESVDLNVPVQDAAFALPAPPPPDFSLAGGKTSTTVPFELLNNHIYVDVKLNGKGPYRLLCDTGGVNVLTPQLAKELGLTSKGALQGRGVGEKSEDIGLTKVETVEIGDATIANQLFAVYPLGSLADVEGVPEYGLVGYEVFKRFVGKIDYERSLLTLWLPSAFTYHGSGTVVPFHFNEHIPQVEGSIDGIPGKFDIDTGARNSVSILAPFAEKHDLRNRLHAKVEAVTGWGVGGPARGLVARAKLLKLGGIEVSAPVVDISLQTKGAFTDPYVAGNVGGGALKHFNLILDYGHQRIIFEPNANFAHPDTYDRAGMWMNRGPHGLVVVDTVTGGPAANAGIEAGDVITTIDGTPSEKLSLPAVRERFRSEPVGTVVTLGVLSKGASREAKLVLRDLVPGA